MAGVELSAAYESAVAMQKLLGEVLPVFAPLLFCRRRYLVLKGGGGSGKSYFAARKVLWRCMSEDGHRMLVVRKVGKDLRDSCFALLLSEAEEYYPGTELRVNRTNMSISFPNGSEILCRGLDNVERLKSITHITGIWIEEATELSERDFSQLDIRLRDRTETYKQIIITFNPISATHWLKRRFFDEPEADVKLSETTYRENIYLPPESAAVLEHFRLTDEYYYSVYCLGEWGVTGTTVFSARAIAERLADLPKPVRCGNFEGIPLGGALPDTAAFIGREDCGGRDAGVSIRIYREYDSQRSYIVGVDTAGTGSDYNVAQVIDAADGTQAAVVRMRDGEEIFAACCYLIGREYGWALIAAEVNFSTYLVRKLAEWGYPHQYVREIVDEYTGRLKKAFGYRTDAKTRPLMIANLVDLCSAGLEIISDRATLEEMQTFIRSEDFRPEADVGAHDDCVMAYAIAVMARSQAIWPAASEKVRRVKWRRDQIEDYERGTEAERAMMRRLWGEPEF